MKKRSLQIDREVVAVENPALVYQEGGALLALAIASLVTSVSALATAAFSCIGCVTEDPTCSQTCPPTCGGTCEQTCSPTCGLTCCPSCGMTCGDHPACCTC